MAKERSGDSNIKNLILSKASNIFKKFGFKKTTMEDIASSLNKAKGSLYYYFKNKEDIFKSIVFKEKEYFKDELEKIIHEQSDPDTKFKKYFSKRFELLNELSNYNSALRDKNLDHYKFIPEFRKSCFEEEKNSIKEILKEGIEKNYYEKIDIERAAYNILQSLKYMENRPLPSYEDDFNTIIHILLYGLIKRNKWKGNKS